METLPQRRFVLRWHTLDTKYRVIADGNICAVDNNVLTRNACVVRYQVPRYSGWKRVAIRKVMQDGRLETKYRNIADGNGMLGFVNSGSLFVGNQVPKNSGRKPYISGSP